MKDTRYQFQKWYVKAFRQIVYTPKWFIWFLYVWPRSGFSPLGKFPDYWFEMKCLKCHDMQHVFYKEEIGEWVRQRHAKSKNS